MPNYFFHNSFFINKIVILFFVFLFNFLDYPINWIKRGTFRELIINGSNCNLSAHLVF